MAETSPTTVEEDEKPVANKFVVEASKAGSSNPFEKSTAGKTGNVSNRWTAARGRLKTSVVLNVSARKNRFIFPVTNCLGCVAENGRK